MGRRTTHSIRSHRTSDYVKKIGQRVNRNETAYRLDESLGYLIAHINRIIDTELTQQIRSVGQTASAIKVLTVLAENPEEGMSVKELSRMTLVQQPTLTKILGRLEQDRLIRRKTGLRDKRVVQIIITAAGRKLMPRIYTILQPVEEQLIKNFSKDEVKSLHHLLKRVYRNLNRRPLL